MPIGDICPNCRVEPITGKASNYCPACIRLLTRFRFPKMDRTLILAPVDGNVSYRERRKTLD